MANTTTVALLYSDTCKLAYTETSMSTDPRAPFSPADNNALANQATRVANCARDLRNKVAGSLNDSRVNEALAQVRQAQALFDYINNTNGVPPSKGVFFDTVDGAVLMVNSL